MHMPAHITPHHWSLPRKSDRCVIIGAHEDITFGWKEGSNGCKENAGEFTLNPGPQILPY
eukprot:scaffold173879_cov17-Tisochrysis_lutea.AAC.1